MTTTLQHIDNNFYRLSAQQAKYLSCDGELPRLGYEKRASSEKLAELELVNVFPNRERTYKVGASARGWIKRTHIRDANGEQQYVWAIHIYEPPTFTNGQLQTNDSRTPLTATILRGDAQFAVTKLQAALALLATS